MIRCSSRYLLLEETNKNYKKIVKTHTMAGIIWMITYPFLNGSLKIIKSLIFWYYQEFKQKLFFGLYDGYSKLKVEGETLLQNW